MTAATLVFAACGGTADIESDYTLNLVPRVLGGQNPFQAQPSVKLVLMEQGSPAEVLYGGSASDGSVTLPEMAQMPAGTQLGILLEDGSSTGDVYDPGALVGYGQATLGQDLGIDGSVVDLEITVGQHANVGTMGAFDRDESRLYAGIAVVPGGDVLLFGGARSGSLGGFGGKAASAEIRRMTNTDSGAWSFADVATLPVVDEEPDWAAMAATTVADERGTPLVLVTGGRPDSSQVTNSDNAASAFLFDPATNLVVWQEDNALYTPRSEHVQVAMHNGNVLVVGGWNDGTLFPATANFEIFDPVARQFTPGDDPLTVGTLGLGWADLGAEGILLCGGSVPQGSDASAVTAECNRIDLQGNVFPAPALPQPVSHLAMAALPDGGVIAMGGVIDDHADNAEVPATAQAWRWDGLNSWTVVFGMNEARAHHRAIPLANGEVMVVGGTQTGGTVFPRPSGAVACTERFDPATNEFSTSEGSCNDAGAGAFISLASYPGEGAYVLSGLWYDGSETNGGEDYGHIALGPDL